MKRLMWVGLGTLAGALALALTTRTDSVVRDLESGPPPLPRFHSEVELVMDGMRPHRIRVPKDHEVRLVVRAAPDAGDGILTINGYEDQVEPLAIGPGQAREIVFQSTWPGDDFAISFNGEILGRLQVTGSHLEEGRQ